MWKWSGDEHELCEEDDEAAGRGDLEEAPYQARPMPKTRASAPLTGVCVASVMAGKVMTASVT